MRAAWRGRRVGGTLLLSVPVGPDVVVWNLHRRYGARRLPLLLHGWEVAARYGWDEALLDAEGNWRQTYEPLLALKRTHAGELPPPPAPPPPPPPEDDREL